MRIRYCKCKKFVRDSTDVDMCALCGDEIPIDYEKQKAYEKVYGKEKKQITNYTPPKKKRK